ncbi:hypothetical protein C8R41DRAFT_924505 [Lentinula lateritia]|uniref:Uncharacterized protein n=1 Tax=Lentinula lateritia TaxID=40482 RepID=A0ABQ8V308_9AGAR|nr:hypothetical protein C8R41DRAFT_924505 [Lentinula lateritia]
MTAVTETTGEDGGGDGAEDDDDDESEGDFVDFEATGSDPSLTSASVPSTTTKIPNPPPISSSSRSTLATKKVLLKACFDKEYDEPSNLNPSSTFYNQEKPNSPCNNLSTLPPLLPFKTWNCVHSLKPSCLPYPWGKQPLIFRYRFFYSVYFSLCSATANA